MSANRSATSPATISQSSGEDGPRRSTMVRLSVYATCRSLTANREPLAASEVMRAPYDGIPDLAAPPAFRRRSRTQRLAGTLGCRASRLAIWERSRNMRDQLLTLTNSDRHQYVSHRPSQG